MRSGFVGSARIVVRKNREELWFDGELFMSAERLDVRDLLARLGVDVEEAVGDDGPVEGGCDD